MNGRDVYAERYRISPQVKIIHPTPLVLLPYLASNRKQEAQMWSLEATGGSGGYKWESKNLTVASLNSQGIVHGYKVGKTIAIAYDVLNSLNNASIEVEVSRVGKFEWLEEKLELPIGANEIVSAIGLDVKHRKFTNCTSIPLEWIIKDETVLKIISENKSQEYEDLRKYVEGENKELIKLKYKFENSKEFNEKVELHNLYGICGQKQVHTLREGIARVMATFRLTEENGAIYLRESSYSQVLAYRPLRTTSPTYDDFLKNIKNDEKDESYKQYLQHLKIENEFIIGFGSGLNWEIEGGTTTWNDMLDNYFEEIKLEPLADSGKIGLQVHPINNNAAKNARSRHFLECSIPQSNPEENEASYNITLKTGNNKTRTLLRPAQNTLTITIRCNIPQNMQLVWAQKHVNINENSYEVLPKKITESYSEPATYYIKCQQIFYARMLIFDKYNRLFYNFSGFPKEISSSNTEIGGVSNLDPYYMFAVELTAKSGSFDVRGQLKDQYQLSL